MDDPEGTLKRLLDEVASVVVGQRPLLEGLLIGLLCDGHVLVEGVPGLAKTTAIRTLAAALGLDFGRVQFTPDLLPGDLTGNPVYRPDRHEFAMRRGPLFTSLLLADEINRAPAKVQSALLEAMEEHQVTIAGETHPLPDPFLVMATQNPVELDGTYPLPEAQVDRFLLKLRVPYPSIEEEFEIVARDAEPRASVSAVTDRDGVLALRQVTREVHLADAVKEYAVRIVRLTRDPVAVGRALRATNPRLTLAPEGDGPGPIALGASPRASIFLCRAARARALLEGRRYATPHDLKRIAPDVLRHRIVPSYEAEAEGLSADAIVDAVLATVDAP